MSKGIFSRLSSLINAPANINAIITQIEAAFVNTLSRDGSTPNQMGANLDMNSFRVLNLPQPIAGTEPVRLEDLNTFIPTITGVIWVWQVKKVLQTLGYYYTMENAISPGPENGVWIVWTAGTVTYVGDSLYTSIASTISTSVADQVYAAAPSMLP